MRGGARANLSAAGARIDGDGVAREEAVIDHGRSDAELVRAARAGSEAALETLFRRHWPGAVRAAYLVCLDRAAAEDIAQEALLAAVRSLDRFDRRRPFDPWLRRIVVNRAIDWTRMRAARREIVAESLPDTAFAAEPPVGAHDDLVAAMGRLAPTHRAVVVMRYLLDFTPGEIARALGIPRGTVNSRLRRGLDSLGRELDQEAVS